MPDPSSTAPRLLRGAALLCSFGLAGVVIVNAQFGCDSPASQEPGEPAKSEAAAPAAAKANTEAEAEAEAAEPAEPEVEANATANPEAEAEPKAKPEPPVFMPASKSAGDFGSARLPGQPKPSKNTNARTDDDAQRQQANPAPQQAQQAQQAPPS